MNTNSNSNVVCELCKEVETLLDMRRIYAETQEECGLICQFVKVKMLFGQAIKASASLSGRLDMQLTLEGRTLYYEDKKICSIPS